MLDIIIFNEESNPSEFMEIHEGFFGGDIESSAESPYAGVGIWYLILCHFRKSNKFMPIMKVSQIAQMVEKQL